MNELALRYNGIAIFRDAAKRAQPLINLVLADGDGERVRYAAEVYRAVLSSGSDTTGEWLTTLVLSDDDPFTRALAEGKKVSAAVRAQAARELETFKLLSLLSADSFISDDTRSFFPRFLSGGFSLTTERLAECCANNGCGVIALGSAFMYTGGELIVMPQAETLLSDLKNYAEEKAEIVKNTENFINGLPAFNALLYGDRGTGKSTTVRAIAYEYRDKLKTVELGKDSLEKLPELYSRLYGLRQKFLLFVDDLSFEEGDDRVNTFKAALEGSLLRGDNVLLYCTSNRRHLVKEEFRDVKNRNDETQAELALFDRFGLVITYINPDKNEFIDILKQILSSRGIRWREEYAQIAELAALKKGGRSPRAAKQIADLIQSTAAGARSDNG